MNPESNVTPEMQALLDQLHDIVVPSPVSAWPPAPGWWILTALLLALLAYGIFALLRRHKRRHYRLEARSELDRLPDQPSPELAQQVSALLKRAALTAYPYQRNRIAGLFGTEWVHFLNHTCRQPFLTEENARILAGDIYRVAPTIDATNLKQQAAHWLQCHLQAPGISAFTPESDGGKANDRV